MNSHVFLIDNLGGAFIVGAFAIAIPLSKRVQHPAILLLPSLGTIAASSLFLLDEAFYSQVPHLWLSAQIIGIVFSAFLGTPRYNIILFALNATIPPSLAVMAPHLDVNTIVTMQAIVYFSSLISIFLSYLALQKKHELVRARDAAKHADVVKSEFLANMSHEIRTPMHGVLGNAEILSQTELTKEQQANIEVILDSGRAMLTILNDILDYSKVAAGQLDIEEKSFDLSELIRSTCRLHENEARSKGLPLILDLKSETSIWISSDATRIRQILSNLISNAIKFTSQGEVRVCAKAQETTSGFYQLEISVIDTGIGLSKNAQSTIFERFIQVDNTSTRQYSGTGLGLAICRKIARLLGGEITVFSQEGKGSVFTLRLEVRESRATSTSSAREESLHPNLKKASIMVVEDNIVNQKVTTAFLERLGLSAKVVSNGKVAVEEASEHQFDIILMDCQMPVMDGYDATRAIRGLGLEVSPIVIAMTANVLQQDIKKCYSSGMDDHLPKPLSIATMRDKLNQWAPKLSQ